MVWWTPMRWTRNARRNHPSLIPASPAACIFELMLPLNCVGASDGAEEALKTPALSSPAYTPSSYNSALSEEGTVYALHHTQRRGEDTTGEQQNWGGRDI